MKLKKYLTDNDDGLFIDQIKEVNDVVLGKNTFLFLENPLVEGLYYPVNQALTEDELSHFSMLTEMLNEKKSQKQMDAEDTERTKQLRALDSMSARIKQDTVSVKKGDKWQEEVKKAYADLTKKSRTAFHSLEALAQKSFVAKYILHGAGKRRTSKEQWGRVRTTKSKKTGENVVVSKELYSDTLSSFKERQRFVNDILAMVRQHKIEAKQAEQKITALMKKFTSLPDLETYLGSIKDGYTEGLFRYTQDRYNDGWFSEDAYLEFLYKIYGKQYNNKTELGKCMKQWSAITDNSKTGLSVDISTVCPKREKLLEMLAEWDVANANVAKAAQEGATESTLSSLRDRADKLKVTNANNPTCAYCYVEAGREMLLKNPNFPQAKKEKRNLKYQDEFAGWTDAKIAKFNKMGGIRFFGSGDYIEDQATDKEIERIITAAEKIGLQLKAITKQEKFVKKYGGRVFTDGPLKGKPVFNINMSVDPQLGFTLVNAINLKKQYKGNVNIRVVALNPTEAIKYSKEKEVDVITLLHFGVNRSKRMSNKDLYVNMSGGSPGWKDAITGMKAAHPKANWNKILTKICCTNGHCTKCPNACGFNPRRVADYTILAKGGKVPLEMRTA